MPRRSIAVAGCGIAGLALATLLSRAGERVVVFDRMQTPAPIGSGLILQPVGLAALDELGVGAQLRALGAPVRRLFGRVQPSGRVVLDVRYRALGGGVGEGVGIHRGALFEALLQAARSAGVEIVGGKEIVGASDGRLSFATGEHGARFDLVVDALGVRSPLSRPKPLAPLPFGALWANVDWPGAPFDEMALEQRYRAAREMVGVLPIGSLQPGGSRQASFFWSLRHRDLPDWRKAGLDAWKDDVLKLWPQAAPVLAQLREPEELIFASYSHGTRRSPVSRGLAHIGDSWHAASPQLGQGANMALLDAMALARAIGTQRDLNQALGAYANARLTHIHLYQFVSWMFTPAYQSDSATIAWARDWLLSPVSRIWPMPQILAALVAGSVGSPLAAIEAVGDG